MKPTLGYFCKITNWTCDFAASDGSCTQPSISLDLDCHSKPKMKSICKKRKLK